MAEYWPEQVKAAEKKFEPWLQACDKIYKRYADEKSEMAVENKSPRRMNLLWANTQTLVPSLYARTPKPEVVRRKKDGDQTARLVAEMLEPALSYLVDKQDIDYVWRQAVLYYALSGRGVAWALFDPAPMITGDEEEAPDDMGSPDVRLALIHNRDFLHDSQARSWDEVKWVARARYMGRRELVQRFGTAGKKVPLDHRRDDDDDADSPRAQAKIWECWCKSDRMVRFVSTSDAGVLKELPDQLRLEGFFPCPRPLLGTTQPNSLIPVPDFKQYRDQAEEIDRITTKIGQLTDALKVAGLYAGEHSEDLQKLVQSGNNVMIPVENFAQFQAGGGTRGAIEWFPLEQVVGALQQLYIARDQAKTVIYEVTGISDVLRGATDPNETATAQGIKAQWGGLRVRDRQAEVQRFARDGIRLVAEIVAENYDPQTLMQISQVDVQPREIRPAQMDQQGNVVVPAEVLSPEQQVMQAVQVMRSDKLRGYMVDIETDSTLQPDEDAEKQARIEFLTAISQLLERAGPGIMQMPSLAPMFSEMVMFGARAFKVGRGMEETIERAMEAAAQQAQQAQGQPDPEQQAKQAEIQGKLQVEQARLQMDGQRMQMDGQAKQAELQMKQQEAQQRAQIEATKAQQDAQLAQQESQRKASETQQQAQIEMLKLQMAERQGQAELAMKERLGIMELKMKYGLMAQEMDIKEDAMEREADIKARAAEKEPAE